MRTTAFKYLLIGLAGCWLPGAAAQGDEIRVMRSISMPEPHGDRLDLAWDGRHFWALSVVIPTLDPGPDEFGRVQEIEPADGSLVSWFPLGLYSHAALAWLGDRLYIANTNSTGETFQYGAPADTLADSIDIFDVGGSEVGRIFAPYGADTVTTGIATNGTYLWTSDAKHREIVQVDPDDGSVLATFPSPGPCPGSLTWDGQSLWNLDLEEDVIYQLGQSGSVLGRWSLPMADPAGLTFDGEYLWVLDDETENVYQIVVPEPNTAVLLGLCGALLPFTLHRRCRKSHIHALTNQQRCRATCTPDERRQQLCSC